MGPGAFLSFASAWLFFPHSFDRVFLSPSSFLFFITSLPDRIDTLVSMEIRGALIHRRVLLIFLLRCFWVRLHCHRVRLFSYTREALQGFAFVSHSA